MHALTIIAVDGPRSKTDDKEQPILPCQHAHKRDRVDERLGLDDFFDIIAMLVENGDTLMAE